MFIISLMFYLFGFERPPPIPSPFLPFNHQRRRFTLPFVIRFLIIFGVLSRQFVLANNANNNNNNNNVYTKNPFNLNDAARNDTRNFDDNDYYDDDEDDDDVGQTIDLGPPIEEVITSYDLYRLKRKLLFFYDRDSRPLYNSIDPIRVYLRIKLLQINNLDEELQVKRNNDLNF